MNAVPAPTNELAAAETEGRDLARQLLEQRPAESFTTSGVLRIRDAKRKRTDITLNFQIVLNETNWATIYRSSSTNGDRGVGLVVTRNGAGPNSYSLAWEENHSLQHKTPSGAETMVPFVGSDFWIADLGLEFFHWPAQKVLKHEMRRGQACKVLESTNPNPSTNSYSRVVSWIDNDTGGIVQAEAFDAKGRLLKEFAPKEFKKVNGQWQLQEMEIRNVQTGSRTRLEFDLENR
jgi:hypothetical protein